MKKQIQKAVCFLLCAVFFAGCKKQTTDNVSPTPEPTTGNNIVLTTPTLKISPYVTSELPIYSISGDLSELSAVTVLLSAEETVTEQTVCNYVAEALTDSKIYVEVNGTKRNEDGTIVIVDFVTDMPPAAKVTAEVESLILDAFGQSILDNIKDCKGITYTIEGEAYSSASLSIQKGEVYMKR